MMTPRETAKDYISRWEGVYSDDADDNGNWTGARKGSGKLVGSQYGVTAAALSVLRKLSVDRITVEVIKTITLDEAATLALRAYYFNPKLDLLIWSAPTASIMDAGWGMGPAQAIKLLQRILDVVDDGQLGPMTAKVYNDFLTANGPEFVAGAIWTVRDQFYELIIGKTPTNAKYEKGWDNRSRYFTPSSSWWKNFYRDEA